MRIFYLLIFCCFGFAAQLYSSYSEKEISCEIQEKEWQLCYFTEDNESLYFKLPGNILVGREDDVLYIASEWGDIGCEIQTGFPIYDSAINPQEYFVTLQKELPPNHKLSRIPIDPSKGLLFCFQIETEKDGVYLIVRLFATKNRGYSLFVDGHQYEYEFCEQVFQTLFVQ